MRDAHLRQPNPNRSHWPAIYIQDIGRYNGCRTRNRSDVMQFVHLYPYIIPEWHTFRHFTRKSACRAFVFIYFANVKGFGDFTE